MPQTARPLTLIVNQKVVYEYDRNTRLPGRQREFLDFMDEDMSRGIELNGVRYSEPGEEQKAHYVVVNLIQAHHDGNESLLLATAAWLAQRQPTLEQIRVEEEGEQFSVQFSYSQGTT